jgi:hypothetical protein
MSMKKEKSAAILTIKDSSDMTARGRKAIASWLRRQAAFFEKHGTEYSSTFRARYLYR